MKPLRPEEEWARSMMSCALDVEVVQHDDGSDPGMHDLDVLHPARQRGAVEVTAAADAACIELWNLMNGKSERWIEPELAGGWLVTLEPSARGRRVQKNLPRLLFELEQSGRRRFNLESCWAVDNLAESASELGIVDALQSGTDYPGSIYITLELPTERSGGAVATTGETLAVWIGVFLKDALQQDVRRKLLLSGASERHAFVFVPGFSTAPFTVADLLMREGAPVPLEDPELPDEVTDVWVVSTWSSGAGFRWSPGLGWSRFAKADSRQGSSSPSSRRRR